MPTKCPICKEISCGDDLHTITTYKGPEKRAGDALKVILLQCYDLSFEHNLQTYEIKALINALIDEHIGDVDSQDDV